MDNSSGVFTAKESGYYRFAFVGDFYVTDSGTGMNDSPTFFKQTILIVVLDT